MSHRVRVQVDAINKAANNNYPALSVGKDWLSESAVGGSGSSADRAVLITATIAAAGSLAIDLQALSGPGNETISLDLVHAIIIRSTTAGATLALEPGASNAWTGFGPTYAIPIGPGVLAWHVAGGYAVAADNKALKIDNDGAASAVVEILIIGQD